MKSSNSRAVIFLASLAAALSALGVAHSAAGGPRNVFAAAVQVAQSAQASAAKPASKDAQSASPRFDLLVRDDFFAGMFHGDKARFARALKFTEDAIAKDPKNGDAWVWLGSAHIQQSSEAYAAGDSASGEKLWNEGMMEMDKGVALEPDSLGVHIGRGAPLLGFASSGYDPDDPEGRAIVTKAVGDYEFALAKQAPYFATLGRHSRGELLFGLAMGWSMLGNDAKARAYLERIEKELPRSPYEAEAKSWLAKNPMGIVQHTCIGCHVD